MPSILSNDPGQCDNGGLSTKPLQQMIDYLYAGGGLVGGNDIRYMPL